MRDIKGIGPYTYSLILENIKNRFPNAKTSVDSLRWYEAKMRKAGVAVPKRKL